MHQDVLSDKALLVHTVGNCLSSARRLSDHVPVMAILKNKANQFNELCLPPIPPWVTKHPAFIQVLERHLPTQDPRVPPENRL